MPQNYSVFFQFTAIIWKEPYLCIVNAFEGLKAKLDQEEWPCVYLFKFIVQSDSHKIAQLVDLFDENAQISFHSSKNGTYTSVSAKVVALDAQSVLAVYQKAANIEGIISL